MKQKQLKKIRLIFAILYLISITFLFVDFNQIIPDWLRNGILGVQFFPALLQVINLLNISIVGLLSILILTFLYGRIYCSFLCPLGILQDIFYRVRQKIVKQKRLPYRKAYNKLRYGLLIFIVLSAGFAQMLFIGFFDPYSIFGRFAFGSLRPLAIETNNFIYTILSNFDIYSIYPYDSTFKVDFSFWFSLGFIVLIALMVFWRERLYCNTICPVGTILSFLAKKSLFKITIAQNSCTLCGNCVKACKAQCIDLKTKSVDFSRCINCFNCIDVCSENGIVYTKKHLQTLSKPQKTEEKTKNSTESDRRKFIKSVVLAAVGAGSLSSCKNTQQKRLPITPPGSESLSHFMHTCTACHLCLNACPTEVLQPAFLEYGFTGMLNPYMDFVKSYCNYECTICSEVCPTSAIKPLTVEMKKTTQIGIVAFEIENCIVKLNGTDCGACAEHCPTKAVKMVAYKENLSIPEITPDICIGCGACEYICPAASKAIYILRNDVHQKARLPEVKKIEQKNTTEDFPF